eukprot:6151026-Prymnesium_polylepis.1
MQSDAARHSERAPSTYSTVSINGELTSQAGNAGWMSAAVSMSQPMQAMSTPITAGSNIRPTDRPSRAMPLSVPAHARRESKARRRGYDSGGSGEDRSGRAVAGGCAWAIDVQSGHALPNASGR